MSAGLPLPKQVFGHGFLLARGGEKMSKSLGNVVDPIALADRYGVDALRYFFLREVSFGQDGTWSEEAIVTRCNAELSNSFGNLAQRVLSMISKNCDGKLPAISVGTAVPDPKIEMLVLACCTTAWVEEFGELRIDRALDGWMMAVQACNRYMDAQAPWALKKSDPKRMNEVLATLAICIRHLAITIQPVIPEAAGKLLDQLGLSKVERDYVSIQTSSWYRRIAESDHVIAPTPLFPRLELPADNETA